MAAQWSSTLKSATVVLTDSAGTADAANTASGCSGGACLAAGVMGTLERSAGKYIFGLEIRGDVSVGGVSAVAADLADPRGSNHWGFARDKTFWLDGTQSAAYTDYDFSDPNAIAVDFDAGKIWVSAYHSVDEWSWVGGGDPATGTSPIATFTPNTPLRPYFGVPAASVSGLAYADFELAFYATYPSTPSGFTIWGNAVEAIEENISETATASEVYEDNIMLLTDSAAGADGMTNNIGAVKLQTDSANITVTTARSYNGVATASDSANGVDTMVPDVVTMYIELAGLGDALASSSNTTSSLTDSANLRDVIQAAVQNLIAETANGADTFNVEAAAVLADIADALGTFSGSYTGVMLVAEMVAALEMYNGADGYDVTESGNAADVYAARVAAIVEIIEERYIADVNEVLVHVMQAVTDTADGTTDITSTGSLLNALLADTVVATIRLNIGGELFTGWVLNTDTLAPSEYQFADRQFNSACKHGSKYLMAAEDGIYEFTESTGVESVMTYIKTGKTDFGSDLKKRIVNSYIVYSASGNMVLKVTTSEYGQLQTRNYRMVPPGNSETTDVRRFDLGRGIKSRYWQFELVGDGVDCDIDEIGMLPIVLSRRI